jgi:hypothetical protein
MAHGMIKARMTLSDGKTPGGIRWGTINILVCLAHGCMIYPDPLNKIPEDLQQSVLRLDPADAEDRKGAGKAKKQKKR